MDPQGKTQQKKSLNSTQKIQYTYICVYTHTTRQLKRVLLKNVNRKHCVCVFLLQFLVAILHLLEGLHTCSRHVKI